MTLPSRKFNGVRYFRRPQVYYSRKDANDAKEWWKDEGYKVKVLKSSQKVGKTYDYRLYTLEK